MSVHYDGLVTGKKLRRKRFTKTILMEYRTPPATPSGAWFTNTSISVLSRHGLHYVRQESVQWSFQTRGFFRSVATGAGIGFMHGLVRTSAIHTPAWRRDSWRWQRRKHRFDAGKKHFLFSETRKLQDDSHNLQFRSKFLSRRSRSMGPVVYGRLSLNV